MNTKERNTDFRWNEETEKRLVDLRERENLSFARIAAHIGTSIASVKHKYRRLTQARNDDRYHHPEEKAEQARRLIEGNGLEILEMCCGWGNMTSIYAQYGNVLAFDIEADRVCHVADLGLDSVVAVRADSFLEAHRLVYEKKVFDVIDIDPYGLPSRFFPHALELISDGIMFVTFPKIGVQKLNKITTEHYRAFWGIDTSDPGAYCEVIHSKMRDFGMQSYRMVEPTEEIDLGGMFRFAYRVEKRSALDLVGLAVDRRVMVPVLATQESLFEPAQYRA